MSGQRDPVAREVHDLLRRIEEVQLPMPPDSASVGEWDTWADLHEIQASLAGRASALLAGGPVRDDGMLSDAVRLLDRLEVRALVGNRLPAYLRLVELMAPRH